MRIERVRTRLLEFPLAAPFTPAWARGRTRTSITMTLVTVETDAGITGISATPAGAEAAVAVSRFVRPHWLGQDPTAIERLAGVVRAAAVYGCPCYFLEVALWDIIGKAAELPVYKLWGGFADRVPAYCATGEIRPAAQRAEDARMIVAQGFRGLKLRFHHDDPRDDLAVVEAVRRAVGDETAIMVDANQAGVDPGFDGHRAWGFHTALAIGRELERLGVLWLEEPLPRHDLAGLARLRDRLERLKLAGGEDNHGLHEFSALIERGCYDVLQPDALLSEGIFQLRKLAGMAEIAQVEIAPHTWGNGIGLLANLHLAASAPNCAWIEYPNDP
ncbi:MAG: mandelate racemase/muconate lactonizing enzyme family protein, partial [Acetobacteraceae bacterium]|nr:mandelate racemase/muconate lactonizing enzyme family protein [Acetobacteraceae bacterium]